MLEAVFFSGFEKIQNFGNSRIQLSLGLWENQGSFTNGNAEIIFFAQKHLHALAEPILRIIIVIIFSTGFDNTVEV